MLSRIKPPSCTPRAPGTRNAAPRIAIAELSRIIAVVKLDRNPSARSAIQTSPEAIILETIQKKFPEEATVYADPIGKEGRLSMEILDDWEAIEEMEMKQLDNLNGPIRD